MAKTITVHDLYVALSQCADRGATVTVKAGKIHVGGKALALNVNHDDEGKENDE